MTKRRKQPMSPRVKTVHYQLSISQNTENFAIATLHQQREIKIENCSGNGDRSSIIFFYLSNLIILQVWSLSVNLLSVLLSHKTMIISTCYLENGIKVKDHSRPWSLTHRLLSHKHGHILGTQICFQLTETDTTIHKEAVRQW
jgi:hypothetical protein